MKSGDNRPALACPSCGDVLPFAIHADAKTSAGVWVDRRGKVSATIPNAVMLPAGLPDHGGSCVGMTSRCGDVCYASVLETVFPAYGRNAIANLATLRHVEECGGVDALSTFLTAVVDHIAGVQIRDGVTRPIIRWHSDGDVYSSDYARAIVDAMNTRPDIDGWIYTRSLEFVPTLTRARNLRVFVSTDSENIADAVRVAVDNDVPVALLARDREESASLWSIIDAMTARTGWAFRPVVCPASGAYQSDGIKPAHVVGVDGRRKSIAPETSVVGACVACDVCVSSTARRSVTFLTHGSSRRASSTLVSIRRRSNGGQ